MQIIKSIKGSMDILNCFTHENPEIGVLDVARELGMSKSSVSRALKTLELGGWVIKVSANQKYRLGPKVLELADIFRSNIGWRELSLPYMTELRDMTDELVTLFVVEGEHRVCVEKVESPHELRHILNLGVRYPLHAGAAGKLLMAYLPEEERKRIISKAGLARITTNTITDFTSFEMELQRIRNEGYAISHQERALSAASVAAPVRNYKGEVLAALCISGADTRFTNEKIPEFIRLTRLSAARISQKMGFTGTSGIDDEQSILDRILDKGNEHKEATADGEAV